MSDPRIRAVEMADQATAAARTHRGESPLEFHLSQWAEETASYTMYEDGFMLEVARVLVKRQEEG